MIASLRGVLESTDADSAVISAAGVGYRVFAPTRTLDALGTPGAEVFVHTHLVVREDEMTLYGFAEADDLRLFGLLTNVNGVGPRNALRLLSIADAAGIAAAVAHEDAATLATAQGIGKKTAARIILELKPVLEKEWAAMPAPGPSVGGEALEALAALGYSRAEAHAALAAVDDLQSLSIEEQVSSALQRIGGG